MSQSISALMQQQQQASAQNYFHNQGGAGGAGSLGQMQAAALDQLQRQHQQSAAENEYRRRQLEALYNGAQQQQQAPKPKPQQEKKMNIVKEYLNKHRDTVMTLGFALLVDHFVLNGALRERIRRVVEALLTKVEKALGVEDKPEQLTK